MDTRTNRRVFVALLALLLATPALAVDGVIEINQARVLTGGITSTDNPGFPVEIDQPGSYRLTSDLTVPSGYFGFVVHADNVTLDLNGFTVFGGGGATADGLALYTQKNIEIRNGTVREFSRTGIVAASGGSSVRVTDVRVVSNGAQGIDLQGGGSRVEGCTAVSNGNIGIKVDNGLVTGSVMRSNAAWGLAVTNLSGYGNNVITGNNGSEGAIQVAGAGIQIATNMCGTDTVCP